VYAAAVTLVGDDQTVTNAKAAIDGSEPAYFDVSKTLSSAGSKALTSDQSKALNAALTDDFKALNQLSTDTDTASMSRKTANDLAFVLTNDKDWQRVAETQGILNAEKVGYTLFSMLYTLYNLLKSAEASMEDTVRWGGFGRALAACEPRFPAGTPQLTYNLLDGANSKPLNTVGAENTTAVYGDKKLNMWSPMVTIHAQGEREMEVTAQKAWDKAEQELQAEIAKAPTRNAIAQALAVRAATKARDLAKEAHDLAKKEMDAMLAANGLGDRGILAIVGDNFLTLGSKGTAEMASGGKLYLSSSLLMDVNVTFGPLNVKTDKSTITMTGGKGVSLVAEENNFSASAPSGAAVLSGKTSSGIASGPWIVNCDATDGVKIGSNGVAPDDVPDIKLTNTGIKLATAPTTTAELTTENVELKATKDIELTANNRVSLMAPTISNVGMEKAETTAAQVKITGEAMVEISGGMIKIG
jgi:hypothetical protein